MVYGYMLLAIKALFYRPYLVSLESRYGGTHISHLDVLELFEDIKE